MTAGSEPDAAVLRPDLCVIGAGPAGTALASAAAAFGVSVVLIARDDPGGSGWTGVAMAALIAAASRVDAVKTAGRVGIDAAQADDDHAGVHEHVQRVVAAQARDVSPERLGALGVTLITGEARFASRSTVVVGSRSIKARRFVIATGAAPFLPEIPGIDAVPILTPDALFSLKRRPERLLVLGGGRHGTALSQAMARLGSGVTLVAIEGLLPDEDPEAVGIVRRALLRDGIALHEGRAVLRAQAARNSVSLALAGPEAGDETVIEGKHLLVADSLKPDIAALDLELGGIAFDASGVRVNRHLRTGNRRVFAIGDCIGMPGSHVAGRQATLVLRNVLFRLPVTLEPAAMPRMVHSRPEIASVGLSEAQARTKAGAITVLRWPFSENDAACAQGESAGFVKIVADRKGTILGATVVGARASELIALWCLALNRNLKVQDVAELALPQPSLSDSSRQAAASFYTPIAARPGLRRLIGFLRRFG